jgi:hypothetical protein
MQQAYRLRPGPALARDVANRHAWVADAYLALGDTGRALDQRLAQQRLLEPLLRADPQNVDYRDMQVGLLTGLAILDRMRGRRTRARDWLVEASRVLDPMVARDPTNRDWQDYRARIAREFVRLRMRGDSR